MKKKSSAKKTDTSHLKPGTSKLRPYSSMLLDGPERAAARAMLYPVGFKEEDFKKPIIGIASTWSNVTPCNMHLDKLALEAEKGANASPSPPRTGRVPGCVEADFFARRPTVSIQAACGFNENKFRASGNLLETFQRKVAKMQSRKDF